MIGTFTIRDNSTGYTGTVEAKVRYMQDEDGQCDCYRRALLYIDREGVDEHGCGDGGFSVIAVTIKGQPYDYPDDFNVDWSERTDEQRDRFDRLLPTFHKGARVSKTRR